MGFSTSKFTFSSVMTQIISFQLESFDSFRRYIRFPFILISKVMTGLLLVIINKASTTADETLSLNHTLSKHFHIVHCRCIQIRLSTRITCNPLLRFNNLFNDVPAKLIYRLFLIRSLLRPHIHFECFLLSAVCQRLL